MKQKYVLTINTEIIASPGSQGKKMVLTIVFIFLAKTPKKPQSAQKLLALITMLTT